MPQTEAIVCDHCSAPLEVPAEIDRVTCRFCGTALQIERTGSVAFSREIETLRSRTDELDRRVSRLEREPAESDGTLEDELDQVSLYGRLLERRRLRERADEERQLQSAVVLFIAAALVGLVALTLFS